MPKFAIYITVFLSLTVGAIITFFVYNSYRNSSLPPGCQKHYIPTVGGCFAKYTIKDITITPKNDCIQISPNNCNEPVLSLKNTCEEHIEVNNITVPPNVTRCYNPLQTFYITADSNNNAVIETGRTCTNSKQEIQLNGQIDSKPVTITVHPSAHPLYNFPPEYESCLRVLTVGGDCRYTRLEYSCSVPLQIADKTINPESEICETNPGEAEIAEHTTAPSEDTIKRIDGQIGEKPFNLTYTLTKEQCK